MPIPTTTWRRLGEKKKNRILKFGALKKDIFSTDVIKEPEITNQLLLDMVYKTKFYKWYGVEFEY